MKQESTLYPPLVKKITVPVTREAAFHRFTEGIASWWPMSTHSVGEEKTENVTLESGLGGRFYETQKDGTTSHWGKVTEWDPPHRLAFTWHPGREPDNAQHVEITFRTVGDMTEVEVIHRDWEVYGEKASEMRERYSTGWDGVLQLYTNVQH